MLARVLLGLAALHLGLSICLNNVCTLPQVCVDVAVECFGCDTVVSGKNLNYSDCPIVIRGFKQVVFSEDGVYGQVTITNCVDVVFNASTLQVQQLSVMLSNADNSTLIMNNTSINVSGVVLLNGTIPNSTFLTNNTVLNASQLVVLLMGNVLLNQTQITSSNIYCTEVWPNGTQILSQPWLNFTFNDQTMQFQATTNFTSNPNISWLLPYFSVILLSESSAVMLDSSILTSTALVVCSDFVMNAQSIINTSSLGCQSNFGAGRGLNITSGANCSNSGASSSGYGGYGTNNETCWQSLQFFQFILHSFPYGIIENPMVSGSAGSNPNNQCQQQSAGGGIVVIQSANSSELSGTINVNGGMSMNPQCSAGSAGSINIFTGFLFGNGNLSAQGGASINNTNGEGSGGFIKLLAFNSLFTGIVDLSAGQSTYDWKYGANDGNLFIENCPPGQGPSPNSNMISTECYNCPAGYYKTPVNVQCMLCPLNVEETVLEINISSSGNQMMSRCYISKEITPSLLGLEGITRRITFKQIAICFGLILLFAIVGVILRKLYKRKKSRLETESFDFEKATQDINNSKIITEGLKGERQFKMADLMYHIHRISVVGANIYDNPWVLSQNPPQELHGLIVNESYQLFAKNLNTMMTWKAYQKYILYISFIIYPLYWCLLIVFKKQKYRRVVKFVESTKINFINKDLAEGRNLIKIKVSKNTDYTICYLDVFRYHQADLKYFMLSCPYIVYLSGEGNFIRPFYLCQTDPFLNVLYFIVNRNIEKGYEEVNERYRLMGNLVNQKKRLQNSSQLSRFIRHFNRSSCTLDLESPVKNFIHGVTLLVDLLNLWNKQFFNKFSVQINLLLITSKFEGNRIIDHQISILERSDAKRFDEFMTRALEELREYDKHDIKFAIFIYNPNQDMSEFQKSKHRETMSMVDGELSHNPSMKDGADDSLLNKQKNGKMSQCMQNFNRALGFVRYNFISHRTSNTSKYVLEFFQIVLILFDATFIAVWQSWLTYPYVGVDFIAPFVGVIWITSSNSYGVGKVFLILNAMACFNDFVEIIIVLAEWSSTNWVNKSLRLVAFILQLGIIAVGCRMITYSKKLNQSKVA